VVIGPDRIPAQVQLSRSPEDGRVLSRLRHDRLGALAAAVVLVVAALSVVRAFGPLTYSGDIWRQADTASIARNFAENGMRLFYPQIDWGGAGPGYVETEFQLLTWLTAAGYLLLGEHEWIGRLISLAFGLVAVGAFWGLARRLLSPAAARWAVIAFALSPLFMRYAGAFMPDVTALAFFLLALLAFRRWLDEDRTAWLAAVAAAVSLAALVKPTSLVVGPILVAWLQAADRTRLRRPALYVAGAAALVAPALWLLHANSLYRTYGNTFGVLSGGDDKFGGVGQWLRPSFYIGNAYLEAVWVLGVVGVPLAVLGAAAVWRERRRYAVVVAGILVVIAYFFAVARYSQNSPQYHIYALPFAALLVGLGAAAAGEWIRPRWPQAARRATAAVLVAALAAGSLTVFAGSLRDTSGTLGVCAGELAEVSGAGDLVVVDTTSLALDRGVPNNWQEPVVFYRADRRGWSLAADQLDPARLAADREAGARFFVDVDPTLVPDGSPPAGWLAENATPVRTAAADGCGIWALR
jgi:hypothetical protein